MFSGTLSLAYTFLLALVLPYAERSAHNADVLTSLMLALQTLLTAGCGDEDDSESHSTGIVVGLSFSFFFFFLLFPHSSEPPPNRAKWAWVQGKVGDRPVLAQNLRFDPRQAAAPTIARSGGKARLTSFPLPQSVLL